MSAQKIKAALNKILPEAQRIGRNTQDQQKASEYIVNEFNRLLREGVSGTKPPSSSNVVPSIGKREVGKIYLDKSGKKFKWVGLGQGTQGWEQVK